MTENGDPYENAIAERTNGILKKEWLYHEVCIVLKIDPVGGMYW
jgi:hypothetical protein